MPESGLPIRVYEEHDMWHVDYGEGETEDHTSREKAEGRSRRGRTGRRAHRGRRGITTSSPCSPAWTNSTTQKSLAAAPAGPRSLSHYRQNATFRTPGAKGCEKEVLDRCCLAPGILASPPDRDRCRSSRRGGRQPCLCAYGDLRRRCSGRFRRYADSGRRSRRRFAPAERVPSFS